MARERGSGHRRPESAAMRQCVSHLSFRFSSTLECRSAISVVFLAVSIEAWLVLHSYLIVFNGQVSSGELFFQVALGRAPGVCRQCVCQVTIESLCTWRSGSSVFLNGNRLCPHFLLKYSFRRAMLQLEFQESKSKLEHYIALVTEKPEIRGVYCGRWRCMAAYHSRNSAFLPFNCGLFFF